MNRQTDSTETAAYSSWRLARPWRVSPIEHCRRSLLQVLALAHQPKSNVDSLSLTTYLKLYAREESRGYRSLVWQLIGRLESGTSLADAIEQTPELVSDEDAVAIRLASQSGTLPETLDQLYQRCNEFGSSDSLAESNKPYYFSIAVVGCVVIAFTKALIFPTFTEMFEEFGMRVSPAFGWLNSSLASWIVILFPVLLLGLWFAGWLSKKMGFTRRLRRSLGSFLSAKQHRLSQAKTLSLLAGAMQQGRPALGVLGTLARYHFDARVRTQLLFAKNEMDLGADLSDSFHQVGLMTRDEADAIAILDTHSERGWLMGKISERNLLQVRHEQRLLAAIVHPLVIFVFGSITLLVCWAVLSMLIKLITSLS